ncbi:hypothetical protein PR202_gb06469 [Eleusine coracana subsp. coracana]|uniref:Uncharacterized protein n=1 Tax=Eleusine coracana subsp. coracana TaxID=191504 RepID=A0AAV5E9H7_ELECO|nr:hypothetical protein PR202_gb06469 [Eleusine coracana subsp. coracana]
MLRLAKRVASKGLLVTFTSAVGDKLVASAGVCAAGRRGTRMDDRVRHATNLMRTYDGGPYDGRVGAGPRAVLAVTCGLVSSRPRTTWSPAWSELPSAWSRRSFLLPSNPFKTADAIITQFRTIDRASWVFVNSFTELEPDVVAALGAGRRDDDAAPPELIPVGPLIDAGVPPPPQQEADDREVARDLMRRTCGRVLTERVAPWCTPVWAAWWAVGGGVAEMAHGLASTGRPFLWVVRPDAPASSRTVADAREMWRGSACWPTSTAAALATPRSTRGSPLSRSRSGPPRWRGAGEAARDRKGGQVVARRCGQRERRARP